jgi:carboxyl-terminal processing protease
MWLKKINRKIKTAALIVAVFGGSFLSFAFVDTYFQYSKDIDIFTSLFRDINIYYVDTVDSEKLLKKGIDEMLNSLDPYTNFIPESEKEDYRYITTGQYGGIGAVIRQMGDYVVISDPYEGYPANKSGLISGDVILRIDGIDTKGKRTDEVSHFLKGTPGTEVKLLIQRGGEKPFEQKLVREEIKVKSVPFAGIVRDGIGYIKLNNFTERASQEVTAALKNMKEEGTLRGVVLDLRGNPGGLLKQAVNISNIFVEKGQEIVSTRGKIRENNKSYPGMNEPVDKDIPLVVLVNSSSASASEIVSGSLQDLDRAVVVGQRTFGKGLVQNTRPLAYNTQLKLTTAKYYIPSGRCIQALDYSHRNEDGSVGKIPDSLISSFKTRQGRTVYDGGGVMPDLSTPAKKLSNISLSLLSKNIIFDFVTSYVRSHPKQDSGLVKLTSNDFRDFQSFLQGKEYGYSTKSEKSLEELKKNAEEENYYAALQSDIDGLSAKLNHNKLEDVLKNKEEIIALLEEEVAARYNFQAGRVRQSLEHDRELEEAIRVINDSVYYSGILSGTIKPDAPEDDTIKK